MKDLTPFAKFISIIKVEKNLLETKLLQEKEYLNARESASVEGIKRSANAILKSEYQLSICCWILDVYNKATDTADLGWFVAEIQQFINKALSRGYSSECDYSIEFACKIAPEWTTTLSEAFHSLNK